MKEYLKMQNKRKLFRLTTVPLSLAELLKGQLKYLNQYYDITAIADCEDTEMWKIITERELVNCHPISMKRDISIFNDIKSIINLYIYFRKEKPFIVHASTPKASLLGMMAAKYAKVPNRLYTVTGLRFEGATGFKRNILIFMERATCWSASKVIPEGEGVKQVLIKNKITSKELKVIANGNINGIDTAHFSLLQIAEEQKIFLKKELNISKADIVFCFIGRLVRDKGINELIKAFIEINKKYSDTKLLLVGYFEKKLDPLLPETEKEIQYNPNIIVAGFQNDVRPYLAVSDIYVFPSYREGFPNTVMQAGAMELPCIVTNINGCNEIIQNGVNGLIIPSRNMDILKDKMLLLLENKELRNKLKSNAREMITLRYEQKMVWEALLAEYKLLENNSIF